MKKKNSRRTYPPQFMLLTVYVIFLGMSCWLAYRGYNRDRGDYIDYPFLFAYEHLVIAFLVLLAGAFIALLITAWQAHRHFASRWTIHSVLLFCAIAGVILFAASELNRRYRHVDAIIIEGTRWYLTERRDGNNPLTYTLYTCNERGDTCRVQHYGDLGLDLPEAPAGTFSDPQLSDETKERVAVTYQNEIILVLPWLT